MSGAASAAITAMIPKPVSVSASVPGAYAVASQRPKHLEARAQVIASAREFFSSRGYLEVETPVMVPSPGLDLHLDAFETVPTGIAASAGPSKPRYLSTSPEYQMKRLLCAGHTKIMQITRAFRAGEFGSRHNSEFTILEFYRAPGSIHAIMHDTEQLVARVTGGTVSLKNGRTIDVRPPLMRMTVCEAYAEFANLRREQTLHLAENNEDEFFRLLVDVVEPALERLDVGVFLTEYPATQASLARKKPGDTLVAERFEMYVAGVELCNGFGELTDAHEQRERFVRDQRDRARMGKPVYPIDERFIEALARGMPEAGGNAIGLDRLIALCTGSTSIGDVIAFTDDEL